MTARALGQPKTFEWWMLSMFAIGISYSAYATNEWAMPALDAILMQSARDSEPEPSPGGGGA